MTNSALLRRGLFIIGCLCRCFIGWLERVSEGFLFFQDLNFFVLAGCSLGKLPPFVSCPLTPFPAIAGAGSPVGRGRMHNSR